MCLQIIESTETTQKMYNLETFHIDNNRYEIRGFETRFGKLNNFKAILYTFLNSREDYIYWKMVFKRCAHNKAY